MEDVTGAVVDVQVESGVLGVEALRPVDVGHRNDQSSSLYSTYFLLR
jgi:hypothetical protein